MLEDENVHQKFINCNIKHIWKQTNNKMNEYEITIFFIIAGRKKWGQKKQKSLKQIMKRVWGSKVE